MEVLTESQWKSYQEDGYLKLGAVLDTDELGTLQRRIDDIMLLRASIDYDSLMMQLDGSPEQTPGSKGATLAYRKIQNLEHDAAFMSYLTRPIFRDICRRAYGDVAISCYRAMFMNKPAKQGTFLPWHQDRWKALNIDPLVTVWTAMDPATIANGCVQIIPGSHHELINPDSVSGFLTADQTTQFCRPDKVVALELEPGEAVLLHNWLLHASDVNKTDQSRRAFSVCYMDARTRNVATPEQFTTVFDSVSA